MTDPLADLSDEGLAGLWAIATQLDQNPGGTVTDWANLGSLDDIGPVFDPHDDTWAGVQRQILADLEPPKPLPWRHQARSKQLPPPGRWRHWLIMAGRGWGKTFVGAGWIAERALSEVGDYGIIAPTLGDAKSICVEGPSGLLIALGGEDGPHIQQYNRSEYMIYLVNGSRIRLGSADAPARIRGWNFRAVWCDEVGSWKDLRVWNEGVKFATRIGDPRILITTTPMRGNKILVKLLDAHRDAGGSLSGGFAANTFLTRGRTRENERNLSADWLNDIEEEFAGTTLGRQELDGELLRAVPGALITLDIIEQTRLTAERTPDLWRVVCSVDPAVTNTEDSDECGIIMAALGPAPVDWVQPPGTPPSLPNAPHLYLLEDYSRRVTPYAWAQKALEGADEWAADAITAETNNGGDLVHTMVQLVAEQSNLRVPRLTKNNAAVGKRARAEPMAGMWEQHRVHVVGTLKHVEDQWASWVPGSGKDSPDRLDASVWAGVELLPHLGVKPGSQVKLIA
jgi:phage terminase large subunit-like protein